MADNYAIAEKFCILLILARKSVSAVVQLSVLPKKMLRLPVHTVLMLCFSRFQKAIVVAAIKLIMVFDIF